VMIYWFPATERVVQDKEQSLSWTLLCCGGQYCLVTVQWAVTPLWGGRPLYNFATIWLKSELVLTNENLTVESKQSKGKGVIYCPLFVISAQCFDCESVEKHQSSGKQRE